MNIYLTDTHTCSYINSIPKSIDKIMVFYITVLFHIAYFYTRIGFSFRSFLYIHRISVHPCGWDLLCGISSTLNIFILST